MAELESQLHKTTEFIISHVESDSILTQASHAQRLEDDPDWVLIAGLGYSDSQSTRLIYDHLNKLLAKLKDITRGDVTKAKELSEMLYIRTHAGERRVQDNVKKISEHRRDVSEGIVLSVRRFVHALHDAGGDGRYPDKVRQAMTVVATSVSKAVALSRAQTSCREIGDMLGLDARLISACQKRFDALDDGEREQLFDDRQAKRSDTLAPE